MDNMATSLTGVENCHFLALVRLVPIQISYSDPYNTSVQRYGGIAKEKSVSFAHFQVIITCTKGVPNNDIIANMATNFSLTAGGHRNLPFFGSGRVSFPSNLKVIPKTLLYKGMVVY